MTDDLVKMARERANAGGYYSDDWVKLADCIEKLEAALRFYACDCKSTERCNCLGPTCGKFARQTLEEK
jgi:hypothetical protein